MEKNNSCSELRKIAKTRITFFDLEKSRSKKLFPVFALKATFRTEKIESSNNRKNLKKYFFGLKYWEYNIVQ